MLDIFVWGGADPLGGRDLLWDKLRYFTVYRVSPCGWGGLFLAVIFGYLRFLSAVGAQMRHEAERSGAARIDPHSI